MGKIYTAFITLCLLLTVGCSSSRNTLENKAYEIYADGVVAYQNHDYLSAKILFQQAKLYIDKDERFAINQTFSYSDFDCGLKCEYIANVKARSVSYEPNRYLALIDKKLMDRPNLNAVSHATPRLRVISKLHVKGADGYLRAGEQGNLFVEVQNIGNGSARDLNVRFETTSTSVPVQPIYNIGHLKPNDKTTFEVPVSAHIDGGTHTFDINLLFHDSFAELAGDAAVTLEARTLSYRQPRLELRTALNNAPIVQNMNNEVIYQLCNIGDDPVFKIKVDMTSADLAGIPVVSNGQIDFLRKGQCQELKTHFRPAAGLKLGDKINAKILVTDISNTAYKFDSQLRVEQSLFSDTVITTR